jgi:hypothetical protein
MSTNSKEENGLNSVLASAEAVLSPMSELHGRPGAKEVNSRRFLEREVRWQKGRS